jgi:hypothetical protein
LNEKPFFSRSLPLERGRNGWHVIPRTILSMAQLFSQNDVRAEFRFLVAVRALNVNRLLRVEFSKLATKRDALK